MVGGAHTRQKLLTNLRHSIGAACREDGLALEVIAWLIQGGPVLAVQQLHAGMGLAEVREVLRGWHESVPSSAGLSPDRAHLFFTLEFIRPAGHPGPTLRLTFDNGKLLVWGESAPLGERGPRGATG